MDKGDAKVKATGGEDNVKVGKEVKVVWGEGKCESKDVCGM